MSRFLCVLSLICFSSGVMAQDGPIVMSSGYGYPTPIYLAPGQLVTLFVAGIPRSVISARVPDHTDLPLSLSGVSSGIWQGRPGSMPILEVREFEG